MDQQTKGRIVSALVPGTFLLGTRLGDWYEKNPYHKFQEGDILILRERNILGYGIRPVAVVNGYKLRKYQFGEKGEYDITKSRDLESDIEDFSQWVRRNNVPQGVERIVTEHELHFKWNVENHFRKVLANSPEEALALYGSREVEQQRRAA